MNNMKYTKDSLAYDFSLFQPKAEAAAQPAAQPAKPKQNIVKMPAGHDRRKKAAAKGMAGRISSILMAALVVAMLCGSIFLRVQITEVTDQIGKAQSVLDEQKSEKTRLLMEMERKVSYKNIEEAAEQLGMQKKERSQVNYISTNPDSKGEVVGNGGKLSAQN